MPNDSGRAEAQTPYQIRMSDLPGDRCHQSRPVWDSGRVASAESSGVAYAGPALQADHTYQWTVRTWNRQGQQSSWSPAERFDAGPMGVQDWSASWLKVADGALVRRTFDLPKSVARARLYTGAQGLVEPHLNGARVDAKQVLDSSVTDYAKRLVYRDFDVTSQLRRGKNALAVMVGQGQFSGSPTFIAQLSITFADGTHTTVSTDNQWRSTAGPVTRDDFYYGESWDARKQIAGWDTAGFDDSGWAAVPVYAPAAQPTSLALVSRSPRSTRLRAAGGRAPPRRRHRRLHGPERGLPLRHREHAGPHEVGAGRPRQRSADRRHHAVPGATDQPPAGDFPGAGFPVRYNVQVSDDPTFATSTTLVDRTASDQPNPGTTPVSFTTDGTGRYVRVTATVLQCRGTSGTFRLAELGVYGPHPALSWGLTHLEADSTPPTRIVGTVAPKRTTTPADGVTVYDFGQNYVGQVRLRADAPAGTKVTVTKGELLDKNGRVTTTNISFSATDTGRQVDEYTFDGSGTQRWMPNFNYAGFRYAELTGLPAGTRVHVTADVIHSDVAKTGSFDTSDPLLNQIQGALLQTQLNDLQGMPLDCPTREKHGWLGDAGDTDTEAMTNLDMQSLYAKWLGDIRTSANADGSVPSVAPTNGYTGWFTDQPGGRRIR